MIDTLLIIVMVVGIIFYALIFVLFFMGKNKKNSAGEAQSIGVGKLNVKASEFIILALVSAIFVVAPILFYYFKGDPQQILNPQEHEFVIRGRAVDDHERGKGNVTITARQLRDGAEISRKSDVSDIEGSYEFRFKSALPDDRFEISWTEPDNREKKRSFTFNEVTFPIRITFQSN